MSLSQPTTAPVTLTYATANGTATAPGDYRATSGTLTIAKGKTSVKVTVPVVGDKVREANETFTLRLSNASTNARIADASGTATIVNND